MEKAGAAPRLLVVACGDIGGGVAAHFRDAGWRVSGLRRDISRLPEGVEGIQADLGDVASIAALPPLCADYVLFTLTPAGYSEAGYRAIFETGLQAVLAKFDVPPKALVFVSSTGVYQQSQHEWVDELSATEPQRFSGGAEHYRLRSAKRLPSQCCALWRYLRAGPRADVEQD
jgi:nucleoside-diphosphate-sugar epimerase